MTVETAVEIREPGLPPRRVVIDRGLELGRECDGEKLVDPGASRRHVKLLPSPLGLSAVDLGSRNGTLLNGRPMTGRATLERGDVLRIGHTEIVVLATGQALAAVGAPPARRQISAADFAVPSPPPMPVVAAPPRAGRVLARKVFAGSEPPPGAPTFRNYLEFRRPIPVPVWHAIRIVSVITYVVLVVCMFIRPAGAQFAFFKVVVPLLPILFFVAPGLWRNICPLAAANQAPRVLKFSRALTAPEWLRKRGYVIAIVLFFGIAGARLAVFNTNATATGILLAIIIASAFFAGFTYKGKSGWCSSICPLLPLQRVYGQTPFLVVPNSHCNPCVACTKNCYDFKPQPAQQADLHDPDPQWSAPRKLFASALPGFVLGFFMLVTNTKLTTWHLYERLLLFVVGSVGGFYAVEALLGLSVAMVVALWASAAINIFYWYASLTLAGDVQTIFGTGPVLWLRWPIRVLVAVLTVVWISRTYWSERRYLVDSGVEVLPLLQITTKHTKVTVAADTTAPQAEVTFLPDGAAKPIEIGTSVLEAAEAQGLPIEAGCRMGVCGADPVAIVNGMDCLSEPEEEELNTLRRLGLAPSTRMACCARVQRDAVEVSLTPERGSAEGARPENYDRSIASVVVLGNGIAGVTAADFVRRGHPDCELHLVGSESHLLYNRMGISRLVYGRSAMTGLYLLAEDWYAQNNVTTWLNTIATTIETGPRRVRLGTGEVLAYDRLIIATGSGSTVPKIAGFGEPGTFVLRNASDAMQIRSYRQTHRCNRAVVSGAGLLGLEAAYALHQLGLRVTVLERGRRLLSKQIDERASQLVQAHFARVGIEVRYGAEARGVWSANGTGRIDSLQLVDGTTLPCDVFLACVGITPHSDIAKQAGIAVNRGVVVDDRMETSVRGVFAAGDVAEHGGRVLGLWPVGAKQGETAAMNAIGGDVRLTAEDPATILKGVDLELSTLGRLEIQPGDEVFVDEDASAPSYRRLIVANGIVEGAIVLGHNVEFLNAATAAVRKRPVLDQWALDQLRAGNLAALAAKSRPVASAF